jgi:hypothetical protein
MTNPKIKLMKPEDFDKHEIKKFVPPSGKDESSFPHVVLTDEDLNEIKKQITEHQELRDGVSFLRNEILNVDPTFFNVLKEQDCLLSGWELILKAVVEGIEHRKHKYCMPLE